MREPNLSRAERRPAESIDRAFRLWLGVGRWDRTPSAFVDEPAREISTGRRTWHTRGSHELPHGIRRLNVKPPGDNVMSTR